MAIHALWLHAIGWSQVSFGKPRRWARAQSSSQVLLSSGTYGLTPHGVFWSGSSLQLIRGRTLNPIAFHARQLTVTVTVVVWVATPDDVPVIVTT
jgi:hypothetical protein